jgi:hypothetical protein
MAIDVFCFNQLRKLNVKFRRTDALMFQLSLHHAQNGKECPHWQRLCGTIECAGDDIINGVLLEQTRTIRRLFYQTSCHFFVERMRNKSSLHSFPSEMTWQIFRPTSLMVGSGYALLLLPSND